MTSLTSSPHAHAITFSEFRDFFLLLPRQISTAEIYRYYAVKRLMGDDGRGAGRVTMEGWHLSNLILHLVTSTFVRRC
jgi:solute carrier family 25 (mitochondrial phosphate transporter), member 23/24/25/41